MVCNKRKRGRKFEEFLGNSWSVQLAINYLKVVVCMRSLNGKERATDIWKKPKYSTFFFF
jgi:hypothetical protein